MRTAIVHAAVALGVAAVPTRVHAAAPAAPKLTKPPELVTFVQAEYPEAARAEGRTATVKLRLRLGATGTVDEVAVVASGGAEFDAAAVAAARQFVFSPAEVDGKPSAITIEYAYAFTLETVAPAPAPATLAGTINQGGSGPIANATIEVSGGALEAPRTATTDAAGRFSIADLPEGEYTVRISAPSLTPVQTREHVAAGEQLEVAYELAAPAPSTAADDGDDLEIVVVAPALRRDVVSTAVNAEQARKVPGSAGDVVRVVESLPGVARASAGSGQLVVWGAAPQDTRIYLDGVPIPRLYHEGGLRSVVHPKLVESVELSPGAYGAQWGRGLGGMVSIISRTPAGERVAGRVAADVLDASAVVSVPLDRRKRWHLAIAGRGSYVQPWATRIFDRRALALVPLPAYGDGQIRLAWQPSRRDRLEIVAVGSVDRFTRGIPNVDPALAIGDRRAVDFGRLYARWTHTDARGGELTLTPFVGFGRARLATSFGAATTSIATDSVLAGVRANYHVRVASWLHVDAGVDAELDVDELRRVGSLALPAREGDIRVFGQPPPDDLAADRWRVTRIGIAPYLQAELALARGKVRIIPGVRVDPYARAIDRRLPRSATVPKVGRFAQDFAAEPRLAVVVQPIERLGLRAAAGLYRQSPSPEDLSASFGTPGLPSARALHTAIGAALRIVGGLSLDVTGFYTQSRRLAMRNAADAPLPAQALAASGSGRAYGMQVLLRQELYKGLFGWVAYTLTRAERRDRDGVDWRLFDYDQPHVLTAVLAYALPRGFEIGGRFRYASGFPRTPVTGAYYDARHNRWQPRFGAHNSIRIPQFVQLDLRAAKRFAIAKTSLEIFVEVLNVWNRRNAEELVYASDYSRRGRISGFPVLPVFGLQWDF